MEDTGIVQRNILFSQRTSCVLFFLFGHTGTYVDWGGGSGLFVRLMRDRGFDFYWHDQYTAVQQRPIDVLTAFECFEHFADPLQEIEAMLSISRSLLFSTVTYSKIAPDPERWAYYAFSHGQHIAFYSADTLRYIAKKFNLNLCTNNKSFHLLTDKHPNNNWYNGLLKLSQLGLPSLLALRMGSKREQDAALAAQKRIVEKHDNDTNRH
jgi:hypothetical protein